MRPFFSAKVHCGPWVVVVNIIEHDEMEKWLILVFGFGIKIAFSLDKKQFWTSKIYIFRFRIV